jgi:putative oxidoreductase
MDAGLLLIRLVFGLVMAAHGTQKLLGWFGGHPFSAVADMFEALGFRPGRFFAAAASLAEITSGLLVALGLLGPVGPALMLVVMIVAAIVVHRPNGLFAMTNGIEVPLLYATAATGLALTGFGRYSLDAFTGLISVWTPAVISSALILGIVAAAVNLALRRYAPRAAAA